MCAEIQQSIIDVLIKKTLDAAKEYKVKSILLGGGVSANNELKKQFEEKTTQLNINFFAPTKNLSTDNALMIAVCAYYNKDKKKKILERRWKNIVANANLRIGEKIL